MAHANRDVSSTIMCMESCTYRTIRSTRLNLAPHKKLSIPEFGHCAIKYCTCAGDVIPTMRKGTVMNLAYKYRMGLSVTEREMSMRWIGTTLSMLL
ncbi:hypothetical protein PILCRDRAFT_687961 [Piloderma croceum F 1598]|uniref:Uncharacterized protein n=1 Tax=Piloderma croceum (strain F 1598) TaxID=765440 RepID=A0A0C3ER84_PILCF|nr:hypothetical protein PILCRDRAFT_687961 [Piloderma croceum F 1598]